ncbi:hypothetical protein E2P81_ATG01638 [Venturia nashicola]|uniref:Secreted protein n=1 Tax=Venturia nashicola TaxID=86259 RepID=A0A4Z1NE72_9PEZI|nr:hypothetical protein E6O75_ATG01679 [Venturia nashicola]TLD18910.1 hypothetical protein E2P81_ATG01638 [Venturia nashicola]
MSRKRHSLAAVLLYTVLRVVEQRTRGLSEAGSAIGRNLGPDLAILRIHYGLGNMVLRPCSCDAEQQEQLFVFHELSSTAVSFAYTYHSSKEKKPRGSA